MKTTLLILLFAAIKCFGQNEILDMSFGDQGAVYSAVDGDLEVANNMAVDATGAFYIAGERIDGLSKSLIISKHLENGLPDTQFGLNGVVEVWPDDSIYQIGGTDIKILNNGKIIVGGFANVYPNSYGYLFRFLSDGTIDSTFGVNGSAVMFSGKFDQDNITSIAIQPDGKIVFCGYNYDETEIFNMIIGRALATGEPDTAFGDDGLVKTNFGGGTTVGKRIKVLPSGKILVAGTTNNNFAFYQLLSNGQPDTDFGIMGKTVVAFSDPALLESIDVLSTGQIIACGKIIIQEPAFCDYKRTKMAFAMLQNDGILDFRFSDDGILLYNLNTCNDEAHAILVQPDDNLLVCGNSGAESTLGPSDFIILKLFPNGEFVDTFGEQGVFVIEHNNNQNYPKTIALQPTGKAIVSGRSIETNGEVGSFYSVRINTGIIPEAESINDLPIYINSNIVYVYPEIYPCTFYLMDMQGKKIIQTKIENNFSEINVNGLPEGVYIAMLQSGTSQQTAKVFVEPIR